MILGLNNNQYVLDPKLLNQGGEGEIYNIVGKPDLVAKIYKKGKNTLIKEKKLKAMIKNSPSDDILKQIAWPLDILYSNNKFIGFVMQKLKIDENLNAIHEFGETAKYKNITWKEKIIIAKNICVVLNSMHSLNHIVGDFNPKNITVNPNNGMVTFVDTDSYHISENNVTYRCEVGMQPYISVELQKKFSEGLNISKLPTYTKQTDNFALAVHIFQLLMNGAHPFACALKPNSNLNNCPQPVDNIKYGFSPYLMSSKDYMVPVFAPKLNILPEEIQYLFERAFDKGHNNPNRRPTAIEWHSALSKLEKEINTCSFKPKRHLYYNKLKTCPWCECDKAYKDNYLMPKNSLKQTTYKKKENKVFDMKNIKYLNKSFKIIIFIIIATLFIIGQIKLYTYYNDKNDILIASLIFKNYSKEIVNLSSILSFVTSLFILKTLFIFINKNKYLYTLIYLIIFGLLVLYFPFLLGYIGLILFIKVFSNTKYNQLNKTIKMIIYLSFIIGQVIMYSLYFRLDFSLVLDHLLSKANLISFKINFYIMISLLGFLSCWIINRISEALVKNNNKNIAFIYIFSVVITNLILPTIFVLYFFLVNIFIMIISKLKIVYKTIIIISLFSLVLLFVLLFFNYYIPYIRSLGWVINYVVL